ncbi:hypothetical protein GCM10007079_00780 [Nocardiopsis terrae]|uniref:Uncharacterized protein n=1 Tax=Nocardiopsis terrae TaxID=372655 RepID=A0ABR9HM96_9ACTN|nr:DUF6716 putative glycosyltransferase [Nocardiopsis terrae]MBE1460130.1 hypothetical protein [Nocardiopsis terrae]GHC69858.1 hypothetical protein GCM10007079_00780 [Nocardiopsis terrae]
MRRTEAPDNRIRVLAVADSDSYVKLSAAMLDAFPGQGYTGGLVVVRSPIAPSETQLRAAVEGTGWAGRRIPVLTALQIRGLVRRNRPDTVILNCTGPVVDALAPVLSGAVRGHRLVLVTALPGISVPATEKAWLYRFRTDLFVVHSHREVAEFDSLREKCGATGEVALATLPFLPGAAERRSAPAAGRVVFAAQAKVPEQRVDREAILLALAELAEQRPDLDVVVKLRGRENEAQTHRERFHYEALWREMAGEGRVRDGAVRFAAGAMAEQLTGARGFVTVSSTAALEAIALEVPMVVLTDFGVGAEQINLVFQDSGAFGTLADVRAARFHNPERRWSERNYFHDSTENDWSERLEGLVRRARRGELEARPGLPEGPDQRRARRRSLIRLSVPVAAARSVGALFRRLRAW